MSKRTYRRFDPWRSAPIKEEARDVLMRSHFFNVEHLTLSSPESGRFERYLVHANRGDTVGVAALTDEGTIPLVEQYRIPTHRWTLEIPAGHATVPGEQPLDIAKRKLRDEAGYEAARFVQFSRFINTPSFSTQHTVLFCATDLTPAARTGIGPETPRPGVRLYTPEEAYELVLNGTIVDAKSIIAVLRLQGGLDAVRALGA